MVAETGRGRQGQEGHRGAPALALSGRRGGAGAAGVRGSAGGRPGRRRAAAGRVPDAADRRDVGAGAAAGADRPPGRGGCGDQSGPHLRLYYRRRLAARGRGAGEHRRRHSRADRPRRPARPDARSPRRRRHAAGYGPGCGRRATQGGAHQLHHAARKSLRRHDHAAGLQLPHFERPGAGQPGWAVPLPPAACVAPALCAAQLPARRWLDDPGGGQLPAGGDGARRDAGRGRRHRLGQDLRRPAHPARDARLLPARGDPPLHRRRLQRNRIERLERR